MNKFITHDAVNDVALIKTSFGYHVRYGLDVSYCYDNCSDALTRFSECVEHAVNCTGELDND